MNEASEPLLQFPTDYPIKVVGRSSEGLRRRIDAIMAAHVPDLQADRISERLSAKGNYLSISYLIHAVSAAQVTALAAALKASPEVLIVI